MTRDVYTEPQPITYLLWKVFWVPTNGGDVLAVAIPTSMAPLLNTVYTLLTIYLFNAVWNVLLHAVMLMAPLRNGLAWNYILSVYWNSAEPFTAWSNLAVIFHRMYWRSSSNFSLKDPSAQLALCLTTLALLTGIGSIAGGILIAPSMTVGNVAPVSPEAVWVPDFSGSLFAPAAMIESPAAIRAVGSAEASRVTLRDKVIIFPPWYTSASTPYKPDFSITYQYNLTGPEFGVRDDIGLVHSVRGRCKTEYGWRSSSNISRDDIYRPWGLKNGSYLMPANSGPTLSRLMFSAVTYPESMTQGSLNTSFALLYRTGHIASFTESGDAMYMTERMPANESRSEMTPFRVKAERPVLSCWQKSAMCVKGECGGVSDMEARISPGLLMILARLQSPMILSIVDSLGPAALMSFFSPKPGTTVDAASSSTIADMERMVLGAYFMSRNILRDATMTEPAPGFKNAMLDGKGQRLEGTGDFVLAAAAVTALSLAALVAIPALTLLFVGLTMLCSYLAHPRSEATSSQRQRDPIFKKQRHRMIELTAANLYVSANMQEEQGANWDYEEHLHPIPTNEKARCAYRSLKRPRQSKSNPAPSYVTVSDAATQRGGAYAPVPARDVEA